MPDDEDRPRPAGIDELVAKLLAAAAAAGAGGFGYPRSMLSFAQSVASANYAGASAVTNSSAAAGAPSRHKCIIVIASAHGPAQFAPRISSRRRAQAAFT
jgi:hypothetical protein